MLIENLDVIKIAAFSDGDTGGNPAGVVIASSMPDANMMQRVAAKVGFSETAFATLIDSKWRVRYFSPESEVPFCGHATIALGAALALRFGSGVYPLILNQAEITVEGSVGDNREIRAALQSPPTHSKAAPPHVVETALALFGYSKNDLDTRIPPAIIHGGADHLVLALNSREALAAMKYSLDDGRKFMVEENLVTILLVFGESAQQFHSRNPFASGGVYEDPATGAATAAFAGYLRDLNWPHEGEIHIIQGEDMKMRSQLHAEFSNEPGSSIRISGTARVMGE